MKRLIVILFALAALSGPVYAQTKEVGKTPLQNEDIQKRAEQERIEKQYNAALKKANSTGEAPPPVTDPWANMRGTPDPKTKR